VLLSGFREALNHRQHLMMPGDDPDWAAPGATFPSWWAPYSDAILQPSKPEITPSAYGRCTARRRSAGCPSLTYLQAR
jgi:hypothetical protein